jgi:TolB-like protein/tetratricopeptide (TPR) repeat protein
MQDTDADSLWTRLRRRKVVQWGIAYAAGSWGLLQGLAYATATFHWPAMLQPLATLGLLIGLPIVLVIAWYHGDRGQQRVTAAELAIITLLFLVGGAMFWRYDRESSTGAAMAPAAAPSTAASTGAPTVAEHAAEVPDNSIAVLPFVNMSGDPAADYFSDGISEEILNVLARTPELQVAARTSSFAFKGQQKEVPLIARELKVRMVLEGSVRRQDQKVRITAQLIDAKTGFHLWSETYDRELKDIFAIQDEIARAIGEKMKVQLVRSGSGAVASAGTTSLEAHDHYLRGLTLWQRRREAELWQAIDEFERAIAIDPAYAPAYGGLALAYGVVADYSSRISIADATYRSTNAAEMALALDPSLPEAYAALGSVASYEVRRPTARALYQRAIALRPSFATAYQWLGTSTMGGGDPVSGLASLERASTLDPRSLVVAENHAYVLTTLGRYAEARAVCEPVMAFAPDYYGCQIRAGFAELLRGRPGEARPYLVRAAEINDPSALPLVGELLDTLEGRGNRQALAARLAAFPLRSYLVNGSGNIFSDAEIPGLLMLLGAPDRALDYLERNSSQQFGSLDWAMMLPALDPIRCDPRFQAVQKRLSINDLRAAKQCGKPAT